MFVGIGRLQRTCGQGLPNKTDVFEVPLAGDPVARHTVLNIRVRRGLNRELLLPFLGLSLAERFVRTVGNEKEERLGQDDHAKHDLAAHSRGAEYGIEGRLLRIISDRHAA